ncbi:MAG: Succinyl-CoA ligase (ADP-forming) subunit alpha [Syntrophorhabdus sp. PtaB.Bin006]|nr:MAG: Succinyl-CoA ligase (ADP-forming) subunit alpha [Syntrophorhabdus sp. PtaB.Bin006]
MGSIKEMLNPQSVALIGATDKESSIGKAVLTNLLQATDRPLYPINPNRQSVLGVPCFSSIRDVPSHVSLAVIVTPAHTVPTVARECGEAGVAGAIILSSGFGESDPQGMMLRTEIVEIRKQYGMRIIGPNCLGVILPRIGLNTTFLATNPKPGNIALLSRALGDAILDWGGTMGIGFSMFVSLGHMIDVGYGDLIDFLSEDYNTKSIMIYMENVGDAKRFISAARSFALSKPIVVLKPGRSEAGAQFIASRTGRPTGDDRVYDAVFKRVGLVRVREIADLFNMAGVLDSRHLPGGPRLAIITNAGDVGIMATDALADLGGELARISGSRTDEPDFFLPEQWGRDEPIDIMGDTDTRRYIKTVEACLSDEGVDGILVIYTPRAAAQATDVSRALIEMSQKTAKPIIVTWIGGERATEGRRILLQNNVPAYATPEEAVKTYLYMYRYRKNIDLLYETPAEVAQMDPPLINYLKAAVRQAAKDQRHILGTEQSLDLLKNYRIRIARTAVVKHLDEILRTAQGVGFPLLLTIRHLHEESEDQVIFLATGEEMETAYREVRQRIGQGDTANKQDVEVILQKTVAPDDYRLKLESKRDPEFRTVLVLSRFTGEAGDACVALPPLNQILARRFLERAGVYSALKGTDAGQATLAKLEDVLLSFSNLVVDFAEIERLELVLRVRQPDVLAGDIKIIPSRDCHNSTLHPHLVIAPYPSRYITVWSLPDGTEVLLRPIRPEDEPMSREMLATLSEETVRTRFFTPRAITRDLLIRSCNIDYDREIAIIVEIKKDGTKRMIGGARLISEPDSGKAQFAILVHDDFQRMGLGAKLIDILIGIAQEKRLDEIYGLVLTENRKMLALCRKLGFKVKWEPDGVSRVTLSLKA